MNSAGFGKHGIPEIKSLGHVDLELVASIEDVETRIQDSGFRGRGSLGRSLHHGGLHRQRAAAAAAQDAGHVQLTTTQLVSRRTSVDVVVSGSDVAHLVLVQRRSVRIEIVDGVRCFGTPETATGCYCCCDDGGRIRR